MSPSPLLARIVGSRRGAVAQLGERRNRTAEVRGSNPLGSTRHGGQFAVINDDQSRPRREEQSFSIGRGVIAGGKALQQERPAYGVRRDGGRRRRAHCDLQHTTRLVPDLAKQNAIRRTGVTDEQTRPCRQRRSLRPDNRRLADDRSRLRRRVVQLSPARWPASSNE